MISSSSASLGRCAPASWQSLVQLGAARLGQAVVGSVADQQVPEAERVVVLQHRRGGRISSLRTSAASLEPTSSAGVSPAALAPPGGGTPHPRSPPFQDLPLLHSRALQPRLKQRLDRRRDWTVSRSRVRARRSPRETAGCLRWRRPLVPAPRRRDRRRADQAAFRNRASASGSSSAEVALSFPPPQVGRSSNNSVRAVQSTRIGAPRERSTTWSSRPSSIGSRPLEIVDVQDHGTLCGERLEQLADLEKHLLRRGGASRVEALEHARASSPTGVSASISGQNVIPSP